MPNIVIWYLLIQFLDKIRPLRPWAYEAHLAAQHVDQLRQFVDAGRADEAPHPRDAIVTDAGPARTVLLGILHHRAEFQDVE